jgi:hypothetical protein
MECLSHCQIEPENCLYIHWRIKKEQRMSGFYLLSCDRLVWYSFDFVSSFYGCSD